MTEKPFESPFIRDALKQAHQVMSDLHGLLRDTKVPKRGLVLERLELGVRNAVKEISKAMDALSDYEHGQR